MKAVWDLKSQFEKYQGQDVHDCMVAEFLLNDGRLVRPEDEVLKHYKVSSLEDLSLKQNEKFSELPKLKSLFKDIEMPFIKVLWQMERSGIKLDGQRLKSVGEDIDKGIEEIESKLRAKMGQEINLNSSVQVGNFLAEKEGIALSKTKTGRYATNENELIKFVNDFEIVRDLLSHRELSKLRSTYVESLIDKIQEDGRVHTTYSQVAVSTGRLASFNPNLQNIPVTSEYGIKIKSCFVAEADRTLVSFDYSQQELRILAHLTGEERLIDAFKNSQDVHSITASQLFSVAYGKVTKEQRMVGKTINFGIIYGMSSFGMSAGLNIPVGESQQFIDAFYKTYPKIKSFYDSYISKGKIDGFVETLLGRRRYVFEYPGQKFIDNNMRRVLMNYPIQGSAADLMRKAMVQIQDEVLDKDDDVKMLLQIHDDLVFEIPNKPEKIKDLTEKVKGIMCEVYPLVVPIEVDVKIGKSWGEMEKV